MTRKEKDPKESSEMPHVLLILVVPAWTKVVGSVLAGFIRNLVPLFLSVTLETC